MTNQMSQQQLLHFIDVVSFAANDISLFLDTHPDDAKALKTFQHYSDLRQNALRTYAENYGPLTMNTAVSSDHWYWATQPWPWEGGLR